MKSNYKFFLGLSFGLLIGFALFNVGAAYSSNGIESFESLQGGDDPGVSVSGSHAPLSEMQGMLNAYKTDFINNYNLPANTSTGGYIKRTVLNDITGLGDGSYIKYSFYYDGDGKIGLYFQKESKPETGIRTGSAAFCPVMCEYPEN